ncbi:hypothetical protein HOD75_01875 [archaeon]|jgi:hypothetical protein|nr:hypothetical protein [archaeon]MBT4241626.1 hypothetical protein [archaeon]MBT4418021.1 hypothetical protein [archaeon]
MERGILIFFIALVIGVGLGMFFYSNEIDNFFESDGGSSNREGLDDPSDLSDGSGLDGDSSLGGGLGIDSEGGSDSGGGIGSNLPDGLDLSMIEESSCGFYFDEYDICGGVCEEGECVSEGRSCYCKK